MPDRNSRLQKAEVLLLTGFLGSGKTTLLKRILSWETDLSHTVVLVNEFGDIGIDGLLLKDAGSDVIELTSGCICCTLSADLRESLNRIWDRFHPRRLFIETSGVSDPKTLVPILREASFQDKFALKKIITLLDADYWEAREVFGPLFYNQLEMADLILLNKIDLVDPEKVPVFLKEIHESFRNCRVIPTIHGGVDPEALFALPVSRVPGIPPIHFYRTPSPDPLASQPRHPQESENGKGRKKASPSAKPVEASGFVSFSFSESRPLEEACFRKFLEGLPLGVFRVKGPVRYPDRLQMLNLVGQKAEWSIWEGKPETLLAFIGWGVDGSALLQKLQGCVIQD